MLEMSLLFIRIKHQLNTAEDSKWPFDNSRPKPFLIKHFSSKDMLSAVFCIKHNVVKAKDCVHLAVQCGPQLCRRRLPRLPSLPRSWETLVHELSLHKASPPLPRGDRRVRWRCNGRAKFISQSNLLLVWHFLRYKLLLQEMYKQFF